MNIRNFSIIAHIDHGKSTLADRMLEMTGAVTTRDMKEQFLDMNPIERERGITIKLAPVRMNYRFEDKDYILNLIDTPGHVDFSYEVSRSLAACEGAVLLIDAVSGIQAQTLTVYRQAKSENLKIIPVLNKIDLPGARPDDIALDLYESFGIDPDEVLHISAKNGIGIDKVFEAIIKRIPASNSDNQDKPLKALVFDSKFDQHRGVIADVRIFDGSVKVGESLKLMANNIKFINNEVGIYQPDQQIKNCLVAGETGYISTGFKSLDLVKVGDTITTSTSPTLTPLPGYKEPKPMVFLGLYPIDNDDYLDLVEALEKLHINDASFTFQSEYSASLGKGYRVGFAGLLHAEIIQQRLEREFNLDLITSIPSVVYQYQIHGKIIEIKTAQDLPDQVEKIFEPWLSASVFTPQEYLGSIMELFDNRRGVYKNMKYYSEGVQLNYELPMAELVTDFFDRLKSISSGYASLDYEFLQMREVDAVKLDILIHHEKIDALSQIIVREKAQFVGKVLVEKLKNVIPRSQFAIAIQAAIGGNILARSTVKAFRKDVTAKLYGGDPTRRKKLLQKQKKGKKRMKQFGKVSLSQDVFLAVMKK